MIPAIFSQMNRLNRMICEMSDKLRAKKVDKIIVKLHAREARASRAPYLSKSTRPRKFGNHVTVHRLPTARPPARPHHRETNVRSRTF